MSKIENLAKSSAQLAPLKGFDSAAFKGSKDIPQELCNFLLALAVFSNDLRDSVFAYVLLLENKPKGDPQKTRAWGEYSGIRIHLIKYQMSLLHELFALVKKSESSLRHQFFASVVMQMPKDVRTSWNAVVDVALDINNNDAIAKVLARIRSKVSNHYDAAEISRGYEDFFSKSGEMAYISLGNTMSTSRFYFADAAVQSYMKLITEQGGEEFYERTKSVFEDVTRAINYLLHKFIMKRGFPYKSFDEIAEAN